MYYEIYLQHNGRERRVFQSNDYGLCELIMLRHYKHALRLHSTGLNPYSWKHDIMTTNTYEAQS